MKFTRFKRQEPYPSATPELDPGIAFVVAGLCISAYVVILSPFILLIALLYVGGLTGFIVAVAEVLDTMRWTLDDVVYALLIFALYPASWWWIIFINKRFKNKSGH